MADVKRIVKLIVLAVVVLGLAYPLAMVGIARIWGSRADGQLLRLGGRDVGSKSIGQEFTSDGFFHGRPSAAGDGYDAMKSGASNLGPSSSELTLEMEDRVRELLRQNPGLDRSEIPVELITASGSGLDPDISEPSALLQVPRISAATGIDESSLRELIRETLKGRFLGIFGEPTVNVLELNIGVLRLLGEGTK